MISVIIPVFNEKAYLPKTLEHLEANRHPYEVLLVDGGSTDGSIAWARDRGLRVLVSSECQRAVQMNLGAQEAQGDHLVFLHADTLLRPDSLAKIATALKDDDVVGGAFSRRFDYPSRILEWTTRMADLRGRLFAIYLGDQCLFVKKVFFDRLGGFRKIDVCEDADFSRRLRKLGKTSFLTPPILSSGRRYATLGPLRRLWKDMGLALQYWLKTPPSPPR